MENLLHIGLTTALLLVAVNGAGLKPVITAPHGTTGSSVQIRVTFTRQGLSTPVSNFTVDDVTVTNGALLDFSGSGHTYSFNVSPSVGEFSVAVDAGAATNRFSIVGPEDSGIPFYTWSRQMEISFPGYEEGRSKLRDFPVLVVLADGKGINFSDFNHHDGVPWADLRFTAADKKTVLNYEVEAWNDADGRSWVWVRVPELAHDTKIYAFWGKAGEAAPASSTNGSIWENGHVGVWHFNESTAPVADSSGSGNRGENVGVGVKYGQPGRVGRGVQMTQLGGNGGVKVADSDALDFGEDNFTVEMWERKEAGSSGWKNIGDFGKWQTGAQPGQNEWSLGTTKTGNDNKPGFSIEIGSTSHAVNSPSDIAINTWNHIAGVRDGKTMRLYVNGVEEGTGTGISGAVNNVGRDLHFGYFPFKASLSTHATLDEMRISSVARSPDWIWATYMCTSGNDTFTTYRVPNQDGEESLASSKSFTKHWAYDAPTRPRLPQVKDADWCRQPIDNFVLAGLESRGMRPSPPADAATWLRRVSFDLVGLPPTIDELDSFLQDTSPGAKSRVVDRLLRARSFGERWARHWLDLARYGDSTGIHEDVIRPSWAWRDWVVQAFNEDMPFDRFTIEQLAGDLLPNATLRQRIATGFHRAAPFNTEGGTPKEARRTYQVLDRVNVTGTVWLATTLECAQCHDHKYDPFTQDDYYRLFAYFNNTPDEMGKSIGAGRAAMAGPTVKVGDTTTFVMQEMARPRRTRVFERGNYETPGKNVALGLPQSLHPPADDLPANRLGLARWLVAPANPLTARVTVNRWWAELFGAGLVRTGTDFGTQGEVPTHPGLLDWLAVEFMDKGWSMKRILRTIVLSSTYGQSSTILTGSLSADPGNLWLSRAPRLRLSAEAIRDNALYVAGILSSAQGGPPVYPPQPGGIWWIRDNKSPVYRTSIGEGRYRRSLYTIWRRSYLHPTLANFDAPDRITCAAERDRTNTPLQALTLLNDPIYLEAALGLALRLTGDRAPSTIGQRIRLGFRLATARSPTREEHELLTGLFNNRHDRFKVDPGSAHKLIESTRGGLVAGISPSDSSAAAELAAWFYLANVLLNLDETITKG
ncbi:MAG: DUF2341 domain-containing protein [Opitutales bacterium]|nr:DUF2341 domain-containing protein [Opitutales bacterium]